jgi:hypothetical protein
MATAPLSMAIQGYAQAALVSFPQDSNWIQPSDSDLNNAYWNAVKGQCPKDVQVWPARDAQGILHLYQPQGGYQTVHTQETTGTNGGEATSTFNNTKQTQSAGSSAISSVHPLDQLSDEGDKVCDYECSVTFNRSAGGVGGEVSPESASGGSKRKRTTRVVVSPEAVKCFAIGCAGRESQSACDLNWASDPRFGFDALWGWHCHRVSQNQGGDV